MTPAKTSNKSVIFKSNCRRSKFTVPSFFFPFFRFDQFHDTQPENSRRTWVVVHCAIFSQRENHVFCIRHTTTSPLLLLLLLLICKLGFSYSSIICKIHCYDSIAIFWMKKVFFGGFLRGNIVTELPMGSQIASTLISELCFSFEQSCNAKHS